MRDRRFVAAHRGGPLSPAEHRLLAVWAADCAEHLLPLFELHSSDDRPRHAIEIGRAWARGEVKTGVAQRAAIAAHAAARSATAPAAIAVARAAGHAVATAHFADHCLGPVHYGAKAVEAAGGSAKDERAWQLARLPEGVLALVVSAIKLRGGGSFNWHGIRFTQWDRPCSASALHRDTGLQPVLGALNVENFGYQNQSKLHRFSQGLETLVAQRRKQFGRENTQRTQNTQGFRRFC